jgi:hypothetical protein
MERDSRRVQVLCKFLFLNGRRKVDWDLLQDIDLFGTNARRQAKGTGRISGDAEKRRTKRARKRRGDHGGRGLWELQKVSQPHAEAEGGIGKRKLARPMEREGQEAVNECQTESAGQAI